MRKKEIWIATNNKGKINEFKKLLEKIYSIKSLNNLKKEVNIIESGNSFEENSLIKAKTLANLIKKPTIADDSGLCIKKLNDFPGIKSARWALPLTDYKIINQKLIDLLNQNNLLTNEERAAYFECDIVYYDYFTNRHFSFKGICEGHIALKISNDDNDLGFGYDPIFIPTGYNETFAQLGIGIKNQISHRKKALDQLLLFLKRFENEAN